MKSAITDPLKNIDRHSPKVKFSTNKGRYVNFQLLKPDDADSRKGIGHLVIYKH